MLHGHPCRLSRKPHRIRHHQLLPVDLESNLSGAAFCLAQPIGALLVILIVDPPHFVIRPKSFYQTEISHSVTMTCVAAGEPRTIVSWRKVSSVTLTDSEHNMTAS